MGLHLQFPIAFCQLQCYFSPSFHGKFLKLEVFSVYPNPHYYDQLSLT